MIKSKLIIIQS